MILTDFNQICIAGISEFAADLQEGDPKKIGDLIRHVVLSTLLSYKRRYGREYGEMVIACDGREYWRKQEFPYYKASRKAAREASGLDWGLIFDLISKFREDLKQVFPYKVVHEDNCEADDIIAVLVKWAQTERLVQVGLMEEPEPMLIISSDGDYHQLHKYRNVRQWSPIHQKFVTTNPKDAKAKLIEKILKGDKGDGIPNFYMPDDFFVNGEGRQKSVMAARVAEFIERGGEACSGPGELRNYQRNQRLIDFEFIPDAISEKIIKAFHTHQPNQDRMVMFDYLNTHRCRQLAENLEQF